MSRFVVILLLIGLGKPACRITGAEQSPAVDFVYPAGGQVGSEFELRAPGRWPEWPPGVWTSSPDVRVTPSRSVGAFKVEIASEATVGPSLLRFFASGGADQPVQFVISDTPELVESEEGEASDGGVTVRTLPVTCNGRIMEEDEEDVWVLPITAPVQFSAELAARSLDSPLLATLVLTDETGQTVTMSEDVTSRDPVLSLALERAGVYSLRVSARDIGGGETGDSFGAGPGALYRLRITTEVIVPVPVDDTNWLGPLSTNILRAPTSPNQFELPVSIRGFISPAGDQDRYLFNAKAEERFDISLATVSVGSPLNGQLELHDSEEALIEFVEGPEPYLSWVAPNDGQYVVWVSAAGGGGGGGQYYDLEISAPAPELSGLLDAHAIRLRAGSETNLFLALRRPSEFGTAITLQPDNLPKGVNVLARPIAGNEDRIPVTVRVAPEAKPANQPIRLTLFAADPSFPLFVSAKGQIRGRHAALDELLVNATEDIWLTILPREED